ncbi:uncharacterized protein [Nicotiana sylvestris]|uniref:uncharacterized protein n=1 Tax=Nicotiana sylvestris TaxID=4096 RepID=UPI00388CCE93
MDEYEACILGLRLAADMDVQDVLVLGDSGLLVHQIQGEWETRYLKLILYRQCLHDLSKRFRSVEFRHIPRIHNKVVDALATLASMLHQPDKIHVDLLHIQVRDQHAYCNMIEEEMDGATPYLLVYGTEVVIPAKVEIPSLRIIAEAGIDDDEWVKA